MADLQKVIEILFQGTDNTGQAVVSVSKGLDAVAGKAQNITGPLADVTDIIVKTNLALAAMGGAFLGFAYKEAVSFESAVLDLQKVLGDTEGAVDQYLPQIEELATTHAVAAENVLSSAAYFKQSGETIEKSLKLTDVALRAVKISELDVNEASTLLGATLRGFGADASDASRLLDILNAVSNNHATTTGELARGMAELSPAAKAAGLSFEETAGILVPIIGIYGSGSEAAQALKTSLLRLGSDTKPVVDALKNLGVSQLDANGALRSSGDILKDVAALWPELTSNQQLNNARVLAGTNHALKFQAALGNYDEVLAVTATGLGATGSAQKEWDIAMGASQEVINGTVESLNKLMRVVGDQYRVEMTGAVGATGDLAEEFALLVKSGGLKPLFDQLRPLLVGLEDDLSAIATALPGAFSKLDLDPIAKGFEAIGSAVSDLFEGVDLTTAEGLESVLQDLANIGGGFLQATAGIIESITPAVRLLADMGEKFGDLSPEAQKASGNVLGFGKVANVLLGFVGPLAGGLEAVGFGLTALAGSSVAKTLVGVAGATTAVSTATTALAAPLGAIGVTIANMATNPAGGIGLAKVFTDLAPAAAAFAIEALQTTGALEDLAPATEKATDAVKDHSQALLLNADEVQSLLYLEREFNAAIKQETDNINQADDALLLRNQRYKDEAEYVVDVIDGVTTYTQTIKSKTAAVKKDTDATKDAAAESENFRLAMEKIASDERITNIEARVTLETAELESSAAITIATFESIDNTITSTGDLLGKLFGELNAADSIRDKWTIEDQIKIENDLRREAAELQSELTQEQIQYLRAKTDALAKGDALITIKGDGLEPELEAFMWRIIDRVQVRASDEGAEFLLGIT